MLEQVFQPGERQGRKQERKSREVDEHLDARETDVTEEDAKLAGRVFLEMEASSHCVETSRNIVRAVEPVRRGANISSTARQGTKDILQLFSGVVWMQMFHELIAVG